MLMPEIVISPDGWLANIYEGGKRVACLPADDEPGFVFDEATMCIAPDMAIYYSSPRYAEAAARLYIESSSR